MGRMATRRGKVRIGLLVAGSLLLVWSFIAFSRTLDLLSLGITGNLGVVLVIGGIVLVATAKPQLPTRSDVPPGTKAP
jgi:hypothetical protein